LERGGPEEEIQRNVRTLHYATAGTLKNLSHFEARFPHESDLRFALSARVVKGGTFIAARAFNIKFVPDNMMGFLLLRADLSANVSRAPEAYPTPAREGVREKIDLGLARLRKFWIVDRA
jgi:hypothetical protein